jgi:hypothetical protein
MAGGFKNLLIIVLLIIAIAHFSSDTYEAGKNWIVNTWKGLIDGEPSKSPTVTNHTTATYETNITDINNTEVP